MLVITTEAAKGKLPKVIVTLDGAEIDALLGGGAQRFPVSIGDEKLDVEILAASTTPSTPKPSVRLRVQDDALLACRIGTVTPMFAHPIPFTLVLTCSDPAPAGPVRIGPAVVYDRIDPRQRAAMAPVRDQGELPLLQRLAIGGALGAIIAVGGYFHDRDAPFYYLIAIGLVVWSVFGKTPSRGGTG